MFLRRANVRYFSQKVVVAEKSDSENKKILQELRKRTGFGFANLRKAIDKFGSNVDEAEKWLHEEAQRQGWAKVSKLAHRHAVQGLIGVCVRGNAGSMLEINCETDFAAKHEYFGELATTIAQVCHAASMRRASLTNEHFAKWEMSVPDVLQLPATNEKSVGDLIARTVSKVSEKVALRRVLCFSASNDVHLAGYTHPRGVGMNSAGVRLGQYGTIVAFGVNSGAHSLDAALTKEASRHDLFAQQLCQHIVGMNPRRVGTAMTPDERAAHQQRLAAALDEEERQTRHSAYVERVGLEHDAAPSTAEQAPAGNVENVTTAPPRREEELLRQEFLLHSELTVADFVEASGFTVRDFARFECGEELPAQSEAGRSAG